MKAIFAICRFYLSFRMNVEMNVINSRKLFRVFFSRSSATEFRVRLVIATVNAGRLFLSGNER